MGSIGSDISGEIQVSSGPPWNARPRKELHRGLLFGLTAIIITLVGGAAILLQMYRGAVKGGPEIAARERAAAMRIERLLASIAEIEDSLKVIAPSGMPRPLRTSASTEERIGHSRDEPLRLIAGVRSRLAHNEDHISTLDSTLQDSRQRVSAVQRLVAALQLTVAHKEARVNELTSQVHRLDRRVSGLNGRVSGLRSEVDQGQRTIRDRDQTIEERRREIGTIYYVVGTKRELRDTGVIESAGGLLGLGKVVRVAGSLDDDAFTPLDTDRSRTIRIHAVKARVVSSQPAESYVLRPSRGGLVLRIVDRKSFREVKHVVILTQ